MTWPAAPQAPSRSNGAPVWRSHQASSSVLPGPESKPRTGPPGARSVRLAMPPRLTTTRCRSAAAKQRRVKCRHKRRALAARGDVAAAKVGDDGDVRELRQPRRIGELRGVPQLGTMANRLAVEADRGNRARSQAGLGENVVDHDRAAVHQRVGGEGGAMDLVDPGALQRVEFKSQRIGECGMRPGQRAWRNSAEIGKDRVDPVDARPRHQADIVLGRQTALTRRRRVLCPAPERALRPGARSAPDTRPALPQGRAERWATRW